MPPRPWHAAQLSLKATTRAPGVIRCDRHVVGPVDTRCAPSKFCLQFPWLAEGGRFIKYYDFAAYSSARLANIVSYPLCYKCSLQGYQQIVRC